MTQPQTVDVPLEDRSYKIHIGSGLIEQLGTLCAPFIADRHVVIISDEKVASHYLPKVESALESVTSRGNSLVVDEGETSKSLDTCYQLWQEMIELPADRKSVVVALGGGVIGDLAGFVAAGFARGIDFIQIPTSLLAQVDSSVGGKTGVNLPQAKNMVGAFWQPKTVVIDIDVLETLDDRNFRAGLAEVIKYGLIMDDALFTRIESSMEAILNREPAIITELIQRCCQCKADVVTEDETETSGRRAILNYGHTIGHAIEAVYGYGEYLHGEAISIGMVAEAEMAKALGMVDDVFCDRQKAIFESAGLPTTCPAGKEEALIEAMTRDKKVASGKLNFILPTKIGDVESVATPGGEAIAAALKACS
ncbi:3-dehydroquinate synthase [Mariniblastus fucicola]|uniref:3-dehydroquinate synthase n=1 Tax=Mariniblastus fucicola TaxID=980251 RepID=A0A5B9P7Z3_9BACT|nr:3-dehydroquinate synthase [Mariniblastus fucicola]QEG21335.1 3-dehydroquinate synthase [Mariniblastus fucicola]